MPHVLPTTTVPTTSPARTENVPLTDRQRPVPGRVTARVRDEIMVLFFLLYFPIVGFRRLKFSLSLFSFLQVLLAQAMTTAPMSLLASVVFALLITGWRLANGRAIVRVCDLLGLNVP